MAPASAAQLASAPSSSAGAPAAPARSSKMLKGEATFQLNLAFTSSS
jgi:hypothetical protein